MTSFCPVIGEILADLVVDGATRHDISLRFLVLSPTGDCLTGLSSRFTALSDQADLQDHALVRIVHRAKFVDSGAGSAERRNQGAR